MLASARAAMSQGEPWATPAMQGLCRRWPHSHIVWNQFARAAVARGTFSLKLVASLRSLHPHSIPLALLLGSSHVLLVRCLPGSLALLCFAGLGLLWR